MSCRIELKNNGATSWPRSCADCGLGPCKKGLVEGISEAELLQDNCPGCGVRPTVACLSYCPERKKREMETGKVPPALGGRVAPSASNIVHTRENSHGDYSAQATASQRLKALMHEMPGWSKLTAPQKESLELIAMKISRITNGNPNEPDHWLDISGYSTLIHNVLVTGNHLGSPRKD